MKQGTRLGGLPALAVLCLLLPAIAGWTGARGVTAVALDLGPGDGPFTSGFAKPRPEAFDPYEIAEGRATHWTSHRSRIDLPLLADARRVVLRLRFVRHFPDRRDLEVSVGNGEAARLPIRRGFADYETPVAPRPALPLTIDLRTEGAADRGLGVSLDHVAFVFEGGARVRLTAAAALRFPLTVALVGATLLVGRMPARRAILLSLVSTLLATAGLLIDPWGAHRLLRGVPETLALAVLPATALARVLLRRDAYRQALPLATALFAGGFLFRALLVNDPRFYNPDYRVHAGLVETAREAGPDLWRRPAFWLYTPRAEPATGEGLTRARSGLWLRRLHGQDVGLPYSLLPHALLGLLPLDYDGRLASLRMAGALLAAAPAALCVFVAPLVGVPAGAALLVLGAPAAAAELALGAVPALFGHAADVVYLLLLAHVRPTSRRRAALLALAGAGAALLYVSSALLLPALCVTLAAAHALFDRDRGGGEVARNLVTAALLGSLLAFLAYYRDFVPAVRTALGALVHAKPDVAWADPGLDRPLQALLLWGFGSGLPLAAAGLGLTLRSRESETARFVLPAWAFVAAGAAAAQLLLPGAFGFVHWPLFAAPAVGLLAGRALHVLRGRGARGAALARALTALLLAHGLWLQWLALRAERG